MSDLLIIFWMQLWQVTIVAMTVWAGVRLFAKNRPHLAHVLWALVLLKCVTPPVFSSQISPFCWLGAEPQTGLGLAADEPTSPGLIAIGQEIRPTIPVDRLQKLQSFTSKESQPAKRAFETAHVKRKQHPTSRLIDFHWKWALLAVWMMGTAIGLVVQSMKLLLFKVKLWRSRVTIDASLANRVRRIAVQVGLRRKVSVLVTQLALGPAVVGLFRPTVVLPKSILSSDMDLHLDAVIAHELVHVRRGDLWWALLQVIAGALFWFHPLVRLATIELTRQCERSCDEETVASLGLRPADYARALLDVFEQQQNLKSAPALPGVKPVEITSARLERVMKFSNKLQKRTPWWNWGLLLIGCIVVLPGAGLAQDQPKLKTNADMPSIDNENSAGEPSLVTKDMATPDARSTNRNDRVAKDEGSNDQLEIQQRQQKKAKRLGLTVDRMLKVFENCGYGGFMIALIQSQDASKNYQESRLLKCHYGSQISMIVLKTAAAVELSGKQLVLRGQNLRIGDVDDEQEIVGDHVTIESSEKKAEIKASGNVVLRDVHWDSAMFSDEFAFVEKGTIVKCIFKGNVRMNFGNNKMFADEAEFVNSTILLRGNARIQFKGSKHPNFIGEEIVLGDSEYENRIRVDGVEIDCGFDHW